MSTTGWAVTIIAIIIILGGGWWYFSSQTPAAPVTTDTTAAGNTDTTGTTDTGAGTGEVATTTQTGGATVHFTSAGFSPKSVTISLGQKVTFVNDTSGQMWVASGNHPTHTVYDGTDEATHCSGTYTGPTPFDECQNGTPYTFVFTKAGTFSYHNHLASQFQGTVVVQ
jgi:plastocyanin